MNVTGALTRICRSVTVLRCHRNASPVGPSRLHGVSCLHTPPTPTLGKAPRLCASTGMPYRYPGVRPELAKPYSKPGRRAGGFKPGQNSSSRFAAPVKKAAKTPKEEKRPSAPKPRKVHAFKRNSRFLNGLPQRLVVRVDQEAEEELPDMRALRESVDPAALVHRGGPDGGREPAIFVDPPRVCRRTRG